MMQDNTVKIFIEKAWLSGDTCVYNIQDYYEQLKVKSFISKKRMEFVEKLQDQGFQVIFNEEDITEDTIYLIMGNASLYDKSVSLEEYKKIFDKKIFESAGKNFNYPLSMSVKEYFDNPFFPSVFKNESTNGGVDKFLVEDQNQLEIIKRFYEEHSNIPIYKEGFDNSIFQQYIETPSKYATYLRVLVAGSGDVLGASLKYAARVAGKSELVGIFEKAFLSPDSKYFINTNKMFNYYSGGQNISFSQPKYSSEKKEILSQHGFDANSLILPSEVLDVCQNIMEKCNRDIGVLCGIDFMLNASDQKWYYLENQAFPAIEEWAQAKNISISTSHNIKGYMKYLELELDARYEALILLVNKRKGKCDDNKQFVLK